jgi:hypothetical protein
MWRLEVSLKPLIRMLRIVLMDFQALNKMPRGDYSFVSYVLETEAPTCAKERSCRETRLSLRS